MDIINIEDLLKEADKKEETKEDKKEEAKEPSIEDGRTMKGFALHPDFIKAYGDKK